MSALPQNSTSGQRTLANKEGLRPLQRRIGYRFRDRALLEQALTHPSSLNELPRRRADNDRSPKKAVCDRSNQRLEFLGDSVLQLIFSEALYRLYPEDREGALSTKRFALVKGSTLSALAREIALYDHIRVGQSERTNTGPTPKHDNGENRNTTSLRDSILEDAFEALVAAIYLDSDLATTREVVLRLYGDISQKLATAEPDTNPKGRLQERVQPRYGNDALHYEVIATHGEAHAREFEVALSLRGRLASSTSRERLATGRGSSKQRAEEAAAREALANWK